MNRRKVLSTLIAAVLSAGILAACSSSKGSSGSSSGTALVGTFKLKAGSCSGSSVTGTYFRMIQPGGTIKAGKFFANPDSGCSDKSYTVLRPGTGAGLKTGSFQPNPTPAFDASGNGLADAITAPAAFTAIKFTVSTNSKDPQTKKTAPAPSIMNNGGKLTGSIQAWSAQWNNLYLNQGAPKPDGSTPGLTTAPTGTYDSATGAYELTWASEIVGGAFNGFTGYWHLQGTFQKS